MKNTSNLLSRITSRKDITDDIIYKSVSAFMNVKVNEPIGMHILLNFEVMLLATPIVRNSSKQMANILFVIRETGDFFIDLFDLEARHIFHWPEVALHSYLNHVDYESVKSEAVQQLLGIEFISIELNSENAEFPISCNSGTTAHMMSLNFSIPIHLRYQNPSFSSTQAFPIFNYPAVFISTYVDNNSKKYINNSNNNDKNNTTRWYFDKTYLNKSGNYAEYYKNRLNDSNVWREANIYHFSNLNYTSIFNHSFYKNDINNSFDIDSSPYIKFTLPIGNLQDFMYIYNITLMSIIISFILISYLIIYK